MDEAIQQADSAAVSNDCVLLSPACASFDMFNKTTLTEVKSLPKLLRVYNVDSKERNYAVSHFYSRICPTSFV